MTAALNNTISKALQERHIMDLLDLVTQQIGEGNPEWVNTFNQADGLLQQAHFADRERYMAIFWNNLKNAR